MKLAFWRKTKRLPKTAPADCRVLVACDPTSGGILGNSYCGPTIIETDWYFAVPKPVKGCPQIFDYKWVACKFHSFSMNGVRVELATTAGKLVYEFPYNRVNLHGRIKLDEQRLRSLVAMETANKYPDNRAVNILELADRLGIHHNRAYAIVSKWCGTKDWWEFGTVMHRGWLTDKGKKEFGV